MKCRHDLSFHFKECFGQRFAKIARRSAKLIEECGSVEYLRSKWNENGEARVPEARRSRYRIRGPLSRTAYKQRHRNVSLRTDPPSFPSHPVSSSSRSFFPLRCTFSSPSSRSRSDRKSPVNSGAWHAIDDSQSGGRTLQRPENDSKSYRCRSPVETLLTPSFSQNCHPNWGILFHDRENEICAWGPSFFFRLRQQ